jgi:hypothetical protein
MDDTAPPVSDDDEHPGDLIDPTEVFTPDQIATLSRIAEQIDPDRIVAEAVDLDPDWCAAVAVECRDAVEQFAADFPDRPTVMDAARHAYRAGRLLFPTKGTLDTSPQTATKESSRRTPASSSRSSSISHDADSDRGIAANGRPSLAFDLLEPRWDNDSATSP